MQATLAKPSRLAASPPAPPAASPLNGCGWLDFPVMHDPRGSLSFIEGSRQIPFDIERVYFLYDIPSQAERAGHAHRDLTQVFIAMSGSFDLHLDDGAEQRTIHLSRANRGYLIQPWIWRTLDNFSGNSICLVLADRRYDEADYMRSHQKFVPLARQRLCLPR